MPLENLSQARSAPAPQRAKFINDEAGVLTAAEFGALSQMLKQHNAQGPGRLVVCIIPRLPAGQKTWQYANDWLAATQKSQRTGTWLDWNDRVLLLVVTSGRLVWLQASPAVGELLNSADRRRIIDETIDPAILAGHFYQGIRGGLAEVSHALQTSPKVNLWAASWDAVSTPLKYFLVYLCCILLLLSLHEGAHALVGWLVGLRVYRITLGYGRRLWTGRFGKLQVELNLIALGGATLLAPRQAAGQRWRLWLAIAAGPGMHVALAGLLYLLARREPFRSLLFCACRPWLQFVLEQLSTANLILLVGNILPYRTNDPNGVASSDGYQLLKLPSMKEAELDAYQAAEFMFQAEERQRAGQPEQAVAVVESALQQFPANRALRLCLAHHRMGVGAYEQAHAEFTALLETWDAKTEPQRRIILLNNIAYAAALLNRAEWLAEADQYSAEAQRTAPAVPAFTGTRGAVLLRLGRVAEGLGLLKRSYRLTSDPAARAADACWLAIGEAQRGQTAEALAWLQKARTGSAEQALLEQAEREVQASQTASAQAHTAQPAAPQQVEYTLTRADYFAFGAHKFRKSRLLRVAYWMFYLLGFGLAPFSLFGSLKEGPPLVMLVVWLVTWRFTLNLAREVAVYWLAQSKAGFMLRGTQRFNRLGSQTLTLSQDGLAHSNASGHSSHAKWDQLKSLELNAEHRFFTLGDGRVYLVPTRAFGAPLEAGNFAHLAATCWQQARPRKRTLESSPVPPLAARVQRQPLVSTLAFTALALLLVMFQRVPTPPAQAEAKPGELSYDTDTGQTKLSELYQMAATLRESHDLAGAETAYKFITELEPLNAPGFVELGAIQHLQKRLAEAEQAYCHAHSLAPRSVSALVGLGSVLLDRQDYAHAEALYRQALALNPQSVEARYGVARASQLQGNQAQARERSRRARELAPASAYAQSAR